jgi:arginase family enzyme
MPTSIISLQARISENTPRDLRGVHTLTELAVRTFGIESFVVEGRTLPFARTPWEEDLAASRDILARTGRRLTQVLETSPEPSLTLATDCTLALVTLPTVARLHPGARVLWLDAHCDFDTPEMTTIGFLGCMSLAGACGRWDSGFAPPIPERQVILCGTRPAPDDFDIVAQRAVESSEVTLVSISESVIDDVAAALQGEPVYVHLDPDVLDPSVFPISYARRSGLSAAVLRSLLETVAARNPIIGVEITAFHTPDDPVDRDRLARMLLDAVAPLLTAPSRTALET